MEAMATQVKLTNEGYGILDKIVQTLHEEQLSMDSNIKILMKKRELYLQLPPPLHHCTQRLIAPLLKQKHKIIPMTIPTS